MNRQPLVPITDRDVAAYRRDGAVALRRVFDGEWISRLADGVARNIAEPGRFAHVYSTEGAPGFFFGDYCNWRRIDEYRRFVLESPAALVAQRMMGSVKVNFFHEHVLVKEPGTTERTPWHQDQPYWTVDGDQVCSIWVPLDVVPAETCVEFVAGSHGWGKWYTPRRFLDGTDHPTSNEGETIPDFDSVATSSNSCPGIWSPAIASCFTRSPSMARRAIHRRPPTAAPSPRAGLATTPASRAATATCRRPSRRSPWPPERRWIARPFR